MMELGERAVLDAAANLGVHEDPPGSNWGPYIKVYLASVGITVPSAWCAAWVNFRVKDAAKALGVSSQWPATGYCPAVVQWAKKNGWVCPKPLPNHAVVYYHASLGRYAHIGLIESVSADGRTITTIEGNTNNDGSREGNAVCRKVRKWNRNTMLCIQIV